MHVAGPVHVCKARIQQVATNFLAELCVEYE